MSLHVSRFRKLVPLSKIQLVSLALILAMVLIGVFAYRANAEDPNLLAAYGFNDTSNPRTDSSSEGNNLTCSATCPTYSATGGRNGSGAYSFAGSNNWLAIPNESQFDFSNNFTVEFWMKTNGFTNSWDTLVAKGDSAWGITRYSTTNDVSFTTFSPSANDVRGTNAAVNNNVWHHVAVTYNTSSKKVFVDGVQVASSNFSATVSKNNLNVRLGYNEQYTAGDYAGWLDDVRIYSRALSQAEIQTDMNTPVSSTPPDTAAPSVPTGVNATATSETATSVTWSASTDNVAVTGYKVYRNGILVASPTGTTFNDTGLSAGTTYSYTVAAVDAATNASAQSTAANVTTPDTTAPTVPANLSATPTSSTQINLSWNASTDNVGVTGYKVYRDGTLIASPTGTTYNDTGLTPSTAYSYTVAAIDAATNASAQTSAVNATTQAPPDTSAPTVPTDLTATASSQTAVTVTWTASTDNVGVTGYKVYRNGTLVASPTGTTFNDTGLSAATSYSYTVAAVDAAGNASAQSSVATVMTPDTSAPTVPSNVNATSSAETTATVTWSASTDNVAVTGYKVYRNGNLVASPTGTTFNDTGLTVNTAYSYKIAAVDAAANASAQSTAATVTTPDTTAPSVPANFTATAVSYSQIDLDWDASTDNVAVTGYKVYRNGTLIASPTSSAFSDSPLSPVTTYTYKVAAVDAAGNTSAQTIPIDATTSAQPDTTAPTVSLTAPANNATLSGTTTLTANATDNVDVTSVKFYRGTTQIGSEDTTSPYSISWNTTAVTDGQYTLTAVARDAAGNETTSTAVTVTVNNAATPGLVAAYGFNNSGSTLADSSANNNTLTCGTSCPTYSATGGRNSSGAYDFAGNGNWLTIPNESQFDFTNNMTASFWMKRGSSGWSTAWESIINKGDSAWSITRYGTTNELAWSTFTPSANDLHGTNGIVADNNWHHVAVTLGSSTKKIYVDGVEKVSAAFASNITNNNLNVRLGDNQEFASNFSGWLDDVRIYNRALSAAEIQTDMNTQVNGSTPPADTTAPSVPTNLSATPASSSQINLSWTASTDNVGVTGYKVYRGGTLIASPTSTSYSDTGLTANTAYSYTVAAVDAAGNASAQSAAVSATTSATQTTINNRPAQAATIAYGDAGPGDQDTLNTINYAHPGGLVAAGRTNYNDPVMHDISEGGGTVLIYLDALIDNDWGRYHDMLMNSSVCGPATALWPGNPQANEWGNLNDFRVGSVLQQKLECVLEKMVAENPHMAGWFADDLGSRSWYPGFNWDNWSTANKQAYRDGAIELTKTFRRVADRHGLMFIVNGTWSAGDVNAGGGYPNMNQHGNALADGGFVEHHSSSELSYFGPYACSAQWASQSPVTQGKAFMWAVTETVQERTDYVNSNCYAYVNNQPGAEYGYVAPWGTFHPTGLPSHVTPALDTVAPSVPTGLSATATSTSQINLSWTASTDNVGVTGYKVYRNGTQVGTPTGTSFSDSSLIANTTYSYTVAAVDAAGNTSAQTSAASATTQTVSGSAPKAWLSWMEPVYFVKGTGTKTVDVSSKFDGNGLTYSLQGTPPSGVTISSSTGVISVATTSDIPWTIVTVRASNGSGFDEIGVDLWVFTPDYTITGGAALSSVSPAPGDIVVVRSATYTGSRSIGSWNGTPGNSIKLVAYPGDTVTFNAASSSGWNMPLNLDDAHDLEVRGFKFIDDGGTEVPMFIDAGTRIKVAQNEFSGFRKSALSVEWSKDRVAAYPNITFEYNRVHHMVQENNPTSGSGGWSSGVQLYLTDNSVIRRNHVYENYGEGIILIGNSGSVVEENIVYDNYSVNIYFDNSQNAEVHGNIVWSTNPTFYRSGSPAASIRAANEYYGNASPSPHQATTGLNITNNRIHSGLNAPEYATYGRGGGSGTSVFTPNTTFTTIDNRWR